MMSLVGLPFRLEPCLQKAKLVFGYHCEILLTPIGVIQHFARQCPSSTTLRPDVWRVEEEAELSRLWKKLVKLYHPDRFANQPDKLETYHVAGGFFITGQFDS